MTTTSFMQKPTRKRIMDTILGSLMSGLSMYHLIIDHQDSAFETHDIGVVTLIVVGAIIIFPNRIIPIIRAWRGT